MINFNVAFPSVPQFGLLLNGFDVLIQGFIYGYDIDAGTLTSANAQFSFTNYSYNTMLGQTTVINSLKHRWVACLGEHLQIFPINIIYPETITPDHFEIVNVPFDYPNLVEWSSGTFEVGVTSVISSFAIYQMTLNQVDITVAKWDGDAGSYGYSGDTAFILDNTNLFGSNCPFTTVDSVNVVKLAMQGIPIGSIRFNLILHKVDNTGPVFTGFAEVRNGDPNAALGPYSTDILD